MSDAVEVVSVLAGTSYPTPWMPWHHNAVCRHVLEGRSWFRRCCGMRMHKRRYQFMDKAGLTAPHGSNLTRKRKGTADYVCLACGYSENRYLG